MSLLLEQEHLTGNSNGFSVLCGGSDAGLLRIGLGQVRIRSFPTVDHKRFSKLLWTSTTELSGKNSSTRCIRMFLGTCIVVFEAIGGLKLLSLGSTLNPGLSVIITSS